MKIQEEDHVAILNQLTEERNALQRDVQALLSDNQNYNSVTITYIDRQTDWLAGLN